MHGRWSQCIVKSKKISIYNKFLRAIMKTYKVKDQEEAVKNAKLFYETVKLAGGFQVTYCYHDLIHMIKNDLCYDLYESDNGWGLGLGAKNQDDADVCTLASILKEEDDNKDDASEKEEQRQNIIDNDNETKDEILKRIISNIKNFYTFRLPPPVSI